MVTLYTGTPKPFENDTSAIEKTAVCGNAVLTPTGLEGDDVADHRFHGGSERALHYYPTEHYQFWRHHWQALKLPTSTTPLQPGAFGENLSLEGFMETDVCVGDRFQLGEVLLEVSEPRCPCHKINSRFGYEQLALLVQLTGRSGWFFRVIKEGVIKPTDTLELVERDARRLTLAECMKILYGQSQSSSDLQRLIDHPKLTEVWKSHARRWLETGQTADWSRRLFLDQ